MEQPLVIVMLIILNDENNHNLGTIITQDERW